MSDQKQGAQQAQSAEGKPEASCSSAASSTPPDTTAQQMNLSESVNAALDLGMKTAPTALQSSAPESSLGPSITGDFPNDAGGASSGAQSMGGSASGALGGASGEPGNICANPGNVCASAADASIAVEAAARCGRVLVDEFEGWDG